MNVNFLLGSCCRRCCRCFFSFVTADMMTCARGDRFGRQARDGRDMLLVPETLALPARYEIDSAIEQT